MRRSKRRILARARDWMAPPRGDPPERQRPGDDTGPRARRSLAGDSDDSTGPDRAAQAAPGGG
jgi:hypothetical protein